MCQPLHGSNIDPSDVKFIAIRNRPEQLAVLLYDDTPLNRNNACLFAVTRINIFQSGIDRPSMTWNTFVARAVRDLLSRPADLMNCSTSYQSNTSIMELALEKTR